ncbi:MAG: AAA family ATPase [Flavobacterium sp.]
MLQLIEDYKKHIAKTELKDEVYKWELVANYKGRPDLDAADLLAEIKSIPYGNLLYQMSKSGLLELVERKPQEMRILFMMLFDDDTSLPQRSKLFIEGCEELFQGFKTTRKHNQDERSISTYLTVNNPEKYTFYKSSFYKKVCKLLEVNEAKKNEKYAHYLDLVDGLITDYIEKDDELIDQVKSYIPQYYDGSNNLILAQDILYQMLDRGVEMNYWIFQGNPKFYDVVGALERGQLQTWKVAAHKDKLQVNDKVIIWLTGENSGCYALGRITSEVGKFPNSEEEKANYHIHNDGNEDRIKIEIEQNLASNPILWETIKDEKTFADFKVGNQGTNFSATKEEYETLIDISNDDATGIYQSVIKILDANKLEQYLSVLREFVKNNLLLIDDNRISFNVRKKKSRLVFIIGNRYAFSIERRKNRTFFSFISLEALSSNSEKFTQSKDDEISYWNSVDNLENYREKINVGMRNQLLKSGKSPYKRYNNSDFVSDVYDNDSNATINLKSNYMPSLNQILYGPPGTGKTYHTVLEAAKIVSGNEDISYDEALKIFNDNLGKQIEFITFHQNYSYEDFIQGLRPDTENGSALTFEKKDGVFKRIADRALKNLEASKNPAVAKKDFDLVFQEILQPLNEGEIEELEIKMKKSSFFITEVGLKSIEFRKNVGESNHTLSINTLRKMYERGLNDLILGGLQPYYNPILELLLEKGKSNVQNINEENFVIIIDEINRANISRVFGELITLIEEDKRSHGKIPMRVTLPSGDSFIVPSNLYIIGTMNTADKSIALLDIALRRRFEFIPMYPNLEVEGINDILVLQAINNAILDRKNHDFTIGHSYFMGDSYSREKTINNKVIPLLLEYFMNDEKEVIAILNQANLKVGNWPLKLMSEND